MIIAKQFCDSLILNLGKDTVKRVEQYTLPPDKASHVSPLWDGYKETGAAAECTEAL